MATKAEHSDSRGATFQASSERANFCLPATAGSKAGDLTYPLDVFLPNQSVLIVTDISTQPSTINLIITAGGKFFTEPTH